MREPRVLTVTELNDAARGLLEEALPEVWVEGEISNFRAPGSGHFYFSLKDARSQIAAAMFQSRARHLRFRPEDGLLVRVRGRVTIYGPRGTFQIVVEAMEPRGIGALQLAFEQLKARLQAEGLFDPARKRPLPALPRRIGLITSPTGAAVRDFLNVLERRHAGVEVQIFPSAVQGEGAAAEIAAALAELSRMGRHDILILARGGGSLEDLWAFNEEVVARAIAASRIPVISAIGHEIDFTIADFVADLRAPTPSAAAEMVIEPKRTLLERLDSLGARLGNAARLVLSRLLHRVEAVAASRAFAGVEGRLAAAAQRLDDLRLRLAHAFRGASDRFRARSEGLAGRLQSLSPLAVLARGYAVCRDPETGRVLRRAAETRPGRRVEVRLHEGGITCEVEEVEP